MTAEQLQEQCELGQAQLMRMEYLQAEATLAAAERVAWAQRDWDALSRLYMPLQETRRQKRQRCGDGIVDPQEECDDANLDAALPKVVNAAYRKAGQVCTSIQILLVHEKIAGQVESALAAMVRALPYGDPSRADTVCGPVISEAATSEAREGR